MLLKLQWGEERMQDAGAWRIIVSQEVGELATNIVTEMRNSTFLTQFSE